MSKDSSAILARIRTWADQHTQELDRLLDPTADDHGQRYVFVVLNDLLDELEEEIGVVGSPDPAETIRSLSPWDQIQSLVAATQEPATQAVAIAARNIAEAVVETCATVASRACWEKSKESLRRAAEEADAEREQGHQLENLPCNLSSS